MPSAQSAGLRECDTFQFIVLYIGSGEIDILIIKLTNETPTMHGQKHPFSEQLFLKQSKFNDAGNRTPLATLEPKHTRLHASAFQFIVWILTLMTHT